MTIQKQFDKFEKENPEFPLYILEEAKKYLPEKVTDANLKKVLANILEEYTNSLVTYNEAIGVITAQSVGQPSTQMALNTFHFAGVSSQSIQGLPRLIEILDAKKKLKTPTMKLYLNKKGMNDAKFKEVGDKIKQTTLSEFALNTDIDLETKVVTIELDCVKLKKKKIEVDSLISLIDKKIRKLGKIVDSNRIEFKATNATTFRELVAIKEFALNSVVFGIKGITNIYLMKEGDEYIIITSGVSLIQVMGIEEVDKTRIYSNDIHKIYDVFGIEAARNVIIEEFMDVVKSQGLAIDERHVLMIADIMTYTGEIKGMTRYGIVGSKQNVLTRASFETALKHIAKGALQNEENKLNTITENVMTNQNIRVGTGIPRIAVKKK